MGVKINLDIGAQLNLATYFTLTIVAGFILPILLISVVHFTGYSEILEEITKVIVVFFLILKLPKLKWQIFATIVFGFLFGLSESILYLNNIFQIGDFSIFWWRFLMVVPMHIITSLVILFSARFSKKFIIIGFIMATIFHILFNLLILSFK